MPRSSKAATALVACAGRHWRKWICWWSPSLGSPDHCRLTSHRFGRSRQAPRLFGQTGSGSSATSSTRLIRIRPVPRPRTSAAIATIDLVFVCRPTTPVSRPHRFRPPRPRRPGDHAPGFVKLTARQECVAGRAHSLVGPYHIAWNQRRWLSSVEIVDGALRNFNGLATVENAGFAIPTYASRERSGYPVCRKQPTIS